MAHAEIKSVGLIPPFGSLPIAANTIINRGEIVQVDASGRAIPGAAANGFVAVGIATATIDNRTGSALGGGAGAGDVYFDRGAFKVTGVAACLEGVKLYVAGPNSVTNLVGSTNGPAGVCYGNYDSTTGECVVWFTSARVVA